MLPDWASVEVQTVQLLIQCVEPFERTGVGRRHEVGDLEDVVVLDRGQVLPRFGGHDFLLEPRVTDAAVRVGRDEDRVRLVEVGDVLQGHQLGEFVPATGELDSEVFGNVRDEGATVLAVVRALLGAVVEGRRGEGRVFRRTGVLVLEFCGLVLVFTFEFAETVGHSGSVGGLLTDLTPFRGDLRPMFSRYMSSGSSSTTVPARPMRCSRRRR